MFETARSRLPNPTLCLVTDLGVVGGDVSRLSERVSVAVENGVNMVQIRAPDLGENEFGRLVEEIVQTVAGRALTIVNPSSRPLLPYPGIDGVQLAENASASIDDVRRSFGVSALVGRSVHSSDGVRQSDAAGADFRDPRYGVSLGNSSGWRRARYRQCQASHE